MGERHTLVIGGTRGIGRAFMRLLSGGGYRVSVVGRRPPAYADQALPGVRHWTVDLLDGERLSATLAEIIREHGKLQYLALFQKYRGEGDAWAGELETSLTATKRVIEAVGAEFDETADDRAVAIVSSIASRFVAEEQPLGYHVAKAGLEQLVRYYAVALGPRGIRVNAVSPGTILKEESRRFYLEHEQLHDLYKRITPLGRMGTAEEIARVIAFLCSPQASFVTGQAIVVDGGVSLPTHESVARKVTALDQLDLTRQPSGSPR